MIAESSEWLTPGLIWFAVGAAFLIAEMVIPGFFLLFFGIGAIVTSFATALDPVADSLAWQFAIFSVVSVVSLIVLRKKFKDLIEGKEIKEEEWVNDDFVGKRVLVQEAISATTIGKVEVNGSLWKAQANETIDVGETVEITELKNLTVTVKKV